MNPIIRLGLLHVTGISLAVQYKTSNSFSYGWFNYVIYCLRLSEIVTLSGD